MDEIIRLVSGRLVLPAKGVEAVVALLDEGATVPFISRYRKERTGALDEVAVRSVENELAAVREFVKRREFVREAIEKAGALTPEMERRLAEASTATEIEDIYSPFKPKRRTRAQIAREKGLEPLAKQIMSGHLPAKASEDDIAGASDIIAEWAAETPRLRNIVRRELRRAGKIECAVVKGKEAELALTPFADYASFSENVSRCASHRYLAMRRAERDGLLKVKYTIDDTDRLADRLVDAFMPRRATGEAADIIGAAVDDAFSRLLRPSIETELAAEMKAEADRVAIDIFTGNLRQLLLAAPLRGKRVLAIDPGYRTGCKVVAVDEHGNLLDDSVIYPTAPRLDLRGAEAVVRKMVDRHRLDVIALGNGTASRETEKFLRDAAIVPPSAIYVVSENGASVYSASDIARQEFPDKDVTVRGAVSIGRRLIDPLAELVKIDARSIGVGQYQHDVDQAKLKDSLDYTVMSCVNAVGVDINTASERLLSYISGIGPMLARNIVAYRAENGGFRSRAELRRVPRMGEKAFELSAGFLRVPGGANPLDNTGIHPESYAVVEAMAKAAHVAVAELPANAKVLDSLDAESFVRAGIGGRETIQDIISELRKPGRDPRLDNPEDAFKPEISSFDELAEGMVLRGIVNNITVFGAFVDLGIKENGLLHISQLSTRRVAAVSDVLKLGQIVTVKVLEVDRARKRISLSMKNV